MKILQVSLFSILLFLSISAIMAKESVIISTDSDELCEEDRSIENQRAKKINEKAQALLVKVMKDKALLAWPVKVCDCWLSSLFGPRKSGHHNGIDLAAPKGTPVYAAADGFIEKVQESSDRQGYGNMIIMSHEKLTFKDEFGHQQFYRTRYAHLDKILVEQDDFVKKGEQIGTIGSSGHVVAKNHKTDPSHLHFEVYRGAIRINPLICLFASDPGWLLSNRA